MRQRCASAVGVRPLSTIDHPLLAHVRRRLSGPGAPAGPGPGDARAAPQLLRGCREPDGEGDDVVGGVGREGVDGGVRRQALELFAREGAEVLVSDVGMPVEDGYSLVGRLRSAPVGLIPSVALTAYATEEDRRRALAAGFDAHVAKPVEPTELVSVIGGLVGRAGPKAARGD